MLGLTTLKLGGGDPWKSSNSPWPLYSPGLYAMWFLQRVNRSMPALLKPQAVILVFPFFSSSWDHEHHHLTFTAAKAPPDLLIVNQFFVSKSQIQQTIFPIEFSFACVRKLSPVYSRKLLGCLCPAVYWVKISHEDCKQEGFLCCLKKAHLLPDQAVCSRHPPQCCLLVCPLNLSTKCLRGKGLPYPGQYYPVCNQQVQESGSPLPFITSESSFGLSSMSLDKLNGVQKARWFREWKTWRMRKVWESFMQSWEGWSGT